MSGDDLLAPYVPTPGDPFDLRKAGHLLRRAAFGGTVAEREALVQSGVERAVDSLFARGEGEDVDGMLDSVIELGGIEHVRSYRFLRMLRGRLRLAERMSYFWHGHFATGARKVESAPMMARQLATFDRLGLARFDELLLAVSRDPAMVRWLDNDSNVKGSPNENFARELFELFALGVGNYTEQDVQEAARAFTGWHLRGEEFCFVQRLHDDGDKQVLGRRGLLGGEDVVALAARHPASARFVAQKLLAFFVHPEPLDAEIAALADCYGARDRDIGATLDVLLRSRLFFSPRAYRSRVKSPADWTVGLVRTLGGRVAPRPLGQANGRMGELLLEPPSVEGWHGERAWLDSASWLLRANFVADLLGGRGGYKLQPDAARLLGGGSAAERADRAILMLLDGDVGDAGRAALHAFAAKVALDAHGAAAILHAVQLLPEATLA